MSHEVILLADNNAKLLETRAELLERDGYQVIKATNPTEAKHLLETRPIDLAVLDIRLIDDDDEADISGLLLVKDVSRSVPKIMLTAYPNWQLVKEALGTHLNELPLAVDFISKQEGAQALLRAIDLNIHRSYLKMNLLQVFDLDNLMDLPDRLKTLGAEEATSRLQHSFERTAEELNRYREQENRRASQYHLAGLLMAILGMFLILANSILILIGYVDPSTLTLVGNTVPAAVSLFFFVRENAAHKRVSSYFAQLNEYNTLGNLITICDSLQSPQHREEYKMKIIDKVIDKGFGGS